MLEIRDVVELRYMFNSVIVSDALLISFWDAFTKMAGGLNYKGKPVTVQVCASANDTLKCRIELAPGRLSVYALLGEGGSSTDTGELIMIIGKSHITITKDFAGAYSKPVIYQYMLLLNINLGIIKHKVMFATGKENDQISKKFKSLYRNTGKSLSEVITTLINQGYKDLDIYRSILTVLGDERWIE